MTKRIYVRQTMARDQTPETYNNFFKAFDLITGVF